MLAVSGFHPVSTSTAKVFHSSADSNFLVCIHFLGQPKAILL